MRALGRSRWLIGRWIEQDQGSTACLNGPYLDFAHDQVLRTTILTGRWQLTGQTLQVTLPTHTASMVINEADDLRFETMNGDGQSSSYRRCTKDDLPTPAQNPDEQAAPTDNLVDAPPPVS